MAVLNKRAAVKKLRNLVFSQKSDLTAIRAKIEKQFTKLVLPNQVDCRNTTVHGLTCDMLIPQVSSNKRMILYIHGGSFMGGSRLSWRNFCASLANETSSRVLVPEFRLAPEYAFPAALEDITAVYKRMCDHQVDIFIAGDGSGGAIALAAALSLPKQLRHFFKGMILFSPWVDLSFTSGNFSEKSIDPINNVDSLRYCGAYYTYSANLDNPLVSPLQAASTHFSDFPPVFIQAGSTEVILPGIKKLADKMQEAGVDCTLKIWDGLFHFFQFVDEYVPQAHLSIGEVGQFVKNIKNQEDTMEFDGVGDLWS